MAPGPYYILHSQEDHAQFLTQEITKGNIDALRLSSFGLWAGINNDGSASAFSPGNPIKELFSTAEKYNVHTEVVIGIPPFSSRAGYKLPPCIYCADAHRRMLQRIFQCRKEWKKIFWFFHPASHTKLAIGLKAGTPIWTVTGGHNLADSDFSDFSVVLHGAGEPFLSVFEKLKEDSDPDISEMRVNFENAVREAQAPPPPLNSRTEDGCAAKNGIFQSAGGPPAPLPTRELPTPEDLISFLYALSRKRYLAREEFTRVSRAAAWTLDQVQGCLRPQAKEAFRNNPEVMEAEAIYSQHKAAQPT